MVSLASSQCLSEPVREPPASYGGMDNRRLMNAVLADYRSVEHVDMAAQTLQNWVARMSLQNHAMPTARSANITERVSVPSSEHVAEIVGRQGKQRNESSLCPCLSRSNVSLFRKLMY